MQPRSAQRRTSLSILQFFAHAFRRGKKSPDSPAALQGDKAHLQPGRENRASSGSSRRGGHTSSAPSPGRAHAAVARLTVSDWEAATRQWPTLRGPSGMTPAGSAGSPVVSVGVTTTQHRADAFLDPGCDPRQGGPRLGDERTTLNESLRGQRLTLQLKCDGLDAGARRAAEPSTMSLPSGLSRTSMATPGHDVTALTATDAVGSRESRTGAWRVLLADAPVREHLGDHMALASATARTSPCAPRARRAR